MIMKGVLYIRDIKNIKGHICRLTCGEWHPRTKETILTSSEDGSLHIWKVYQNFLSQTQVIKPKLARPGRIPVTTCGWDRDGKRIIGGIGDGSIQVWDLRQMKEVLEDFYGLANNYPQTNGAFSPDEQIIMTGTSVEELVCFYNRTKLEIVQKVGISPTCSVVQCTWHPRLNQIFVTSGDKSQGGTHILYDPSQSERGACVWIARAPRKKFVDDYQPEPVIHNPHALPLFRDAPSGKRKKEKTL